MSDNIILLTDSYKPTHWKQYPPGTSEVYAYLESRGGLFNSTLYYGLQFILKKYLVGKVITIEKINEAKLIIDAHLGPGLFNESGWKYILEKYDGHLPIKIKSVSEGISVPTGNVLMTVQNTDPKVPWLTNYLESILLQVWYPITVGTLSREIKKIFAKYLNKTSCGTPQDIENIISFMLHDFGFRGVSSTESAGIGGSAHIINFLGSDNIPSMVLAQKYYNAKNPIAFSIPASEHSTITSWTEPCEVDAFNNMLDAYPTGLVACVSDSFDIIRACRDYWGTTLREKILKRDGRLVIRPDSGDPVETLRQIFPILWEKFGGIINEKGFKVIDPHVRVIQGDGVNYESIGLVLDMMVHEGFSVENIAFGMGGALLQKVDRDTQKFAFKCSSITIDGKERDVKKNPIEINRLGERVQSFKVSKSGKLKLIDFRTIERSNTDDPNDQLIEVFNNGKLVNEITFDEIRKNARI